MKSFILMAAITGALLGAPAMADPSMSQLHAETVRTDDLDLGRTADVIKLNARVGRAIRSVCGTYSSTDLAGQNEVRRCRVNLRPNAAAETERLIAENRRAEALAANQGRQRGDTPRLTDAP